VGGGEGGSTADSAPAAAVPRAGLGPPSAGLRHRPRRPQRDHVLARDEITGVVDRDHLGLGSRAADLTSLLFEWQRLQLADEAAVASDGGERLVRRIVEIAGEDGLRCMVAYAAIARLALSAQRGEHAELERWRQVGAAILGFVC
jgi:hypothetical protein